MKKAAKKKPLPPAFQKALDEAAARLGVSPEKLENFFVRFAEAATNPPRKLPLAKPLANPPPILGGLSKQKKIARAAGRLGARLTGGVFPSVSPELSAKRAGAARSKARFKHRAIIAFIQAEVTKRMGTGLRITTARRDVAEMLESARGSGQPVAYLLKHHRSDLLSQVSPKTIEQRMTGVLPGEARRTAERGVRLAAMKWLVGQGLCDSRRGKITPGMVKTVCKICNAREAEVVETNKDGASLAT